ncbi:phosphate/phosphite/phosphonate ABC transporter substrate-binding protein [Aquibacillus koreensis]|uniref:Phosphate/phosphite/phosphonate ABC transporter substrate-binding protein n=1 Tax=Aquibacillus koreensis TaxID=279446 RepID=A0A9X3WLG2_9BACI|nr:phosphate/phosphite/phosphonate ABC transporter substrate-binding protein [Aquibacillus koreensis]MCT2538156.1 phosphate/phosphite/phosphonate ABC transporter substrate-binding protein [Aquibacillus koreensis]MDC3420900.1 phosphate/phosphite/phosphonate ABC transporter substrate-binding protein [Aquibacillus koreensis]
MKKKLLSIIFAAIAVLFIAGCGEDDTLVMGFVPSQDSDEIADTVAPLAEKLSEELGREVEGKVMTNYTALVEAMGTNEVQIGFIPAFGYVLASQEHDVEVLLKSERFGSGSYVAQYIVRADSGIESLEDLEGKTWAYGDPTSTSGYLFPAAQIMDEFGVEDPSTEFFGNTVQSGGHDQSAIAVLEGEADVATTFDDVRTGLEEDYPEIMEETKILGYTDEIPNDTISVTKELDDELVAEIKEVFLSFNDDEEMIKIMNDVYNWDKIIEATDSEYDIVRDTYSKFSDLSIDDL